MTSSIRNSILFIFNKAPSSNGPPLVPQPTPESRPHGASKRFSGFFFSAPSPALEPKPRPAGADTSGFFNAVSPKPQPRPRCASTPNKRTLNPTSPSLEPSKPRPRRASTNSRRSSGFFNSATSPEVKPRQRIASTNSTKRSSGFFNATSPESQSRPRVGSTATSKRSSWLFNGDTWGRLRKSFGNLQRRRSFTQRRRGKLVMNSLTCKRHANFLFDFYLKDQIRDNKICESSKKFYLIIPLNRKL